MSAENILSAYAQASMNCDKIIQISYEVLQGTSERSNLSQAKRHGQDPRARLQWKW